MQRKKHHDPGKTKFVVSEHRASRRGGNGRRRELRVSSISRAGGIHRHREQVVPYIRMSGQWLERLGFQSGDRIEITEERERLVLTLSRDDRQQLIN